MTTEGMIILVAFAAASSAVLLICTLVGGRRGRLEARLDDLSGRGVAAELEQESLAKLARTALPRMGSPLIPKSEEERTKLQARLVHAGLYGRQAMVAFLGTKVMLLVPVLPLMAATALKLIPAGTGMMAALGLGIAGLIGPSFWLDNRKKGRQTTFRRALPDALDVLVICMEGGLSLQAGLRYVAQELRTAHPGLAAELGIVQREVQLGQSTGEALRQMGERVDLEEVRGLASVIIQADRFGASLVKSLRVHAETLRLKRRQRAEELAQKASTKMLIPTVLFIFPAMFIVLLGPAIIHVMRLLPSVMP